MGIGEAIAQAFCQSGANVVLSSRDIARAEEARTRLNAPDRTLAVACDVRDRKQIDKLADAAIQRFARIDIWVNNAGHGLLDSVATMDMDACRSMFDTNLFGAIDGMQVAALIMKRQKCGIIVNISSVAGHIAVPWMAAYSASKHALNAISKAARIELEDFGIHVMTVCPGYIATDFGKNALRGTDVRRRQESEGGRTTPDQVAHAVLEGCRKRKNEIVVPAKDWLKIIAYQRLPKIVDRAMKRMQKPLT
jgi:short-subunit dehydrogenase